MAYRRIPTTWDNVPLIMNTALAGKILGVSSCTINNYVNSGALKAVRPTAGGRSIKITKEALMELCGVNKQ